MTNDLDRRSVLKRGAILALLASTPQSARARSTHIDSLLSQMTLAEKAGQLSCFNDDIRPVGAVFNPTINARGKAEMLAEAQAGHVGMLFNGYGVKGARLAQQAALKSRLGIPLLFAADVIHGCRTIFPIPLAEAAAFDPDLSERAARAIAVETSAAGLHWTFAPVVDVARDQRWGRVAEGAGEDVYLNKVLAAARVRGFQGSDLKAADSLLATPKHFASYGAVRGGMEYADVQVSEQALREIFLPPFDAAFGAGARATISSFTDINGIPATANHWLLTELLRNEMGFKGVVVSDYDADRELIAHGVAKNERDAARLALLAGVDVSMQSNLYNLHLPDLVTDGEVPMAIVDQAVRRVLELKDALGLFENPFRSLDPLVEERSTATPAIKALAREVATRSIVLLRNEGGLLPLSRSGQKLALIGPFGTDKANLNGPWSFAGDPKDGIDLATGIRAMMDDPSLLTIEQGCTIHEAVPGGIEHAVAAAKSADVVLLAVGEGGDMSGEGNSRADITLPKAQQDLVDTIHLCATPSVVLLRTGRALALSGSIPSTNALLVTWFLGEQTGPAVADILFGACEPTGRLPVSFPIMSGQQPWSYDHKSTGRPAPDNVPMEPGKGHWRDAPDRALFPFGSGMGFTEFRVSNLLVPSLLASGTALSVQADITNIGQRRGETLVEFHVRDLVASRTRPIRQLKTFGHITLNPGETQSLSCTIAYDDLSLFSADGEMRVRSGAFELMIAIGGQVKMAAGFEVA